MGDTGHAEKAIKLAERITSPPMPWQAWCVRQVLSTDELGNWTHPDNVIIVPRQNGKSWVLVVIIIYKLFILGEKIIFTAQRWKTAEDIYMRCWTIVEARTSLKRRVVRNTCSQGQGTIRLAGGAEVTFTTRSPDTGRGLTEIDTVIYDEAYNLTEAETSALLFAQMAASNPQTIYTSSAVNAEIHNFGQVLTGVRKLGLDKTEGIFFAEWMAPEGMDREAESTWQYANPSYGIIQTSAKVKKTMVGMNTLAGQKAFDVELLGRGDWPTLDTGVIEPIIPFDTWQSKHNPAPRLAGDHTLAFDVSPDGGNISIVSASRIAGGKVFLSLAPARNFDRVEAMAQINKAVELNDPIAVGFDPDGKTGVMDTGVRQAGLDPEYMRIRRITAATELFFELFNEGMIEHDDNPRWIEALAAAEFREMNSGRALKKRAGDITPLVAATFVGSSCGGSMLTSR